MLHPLDMSATVAIAHTREKHRSIERVHALVREALDHLGGIQSFVKPGQTVLLKPDDSSAGEACATDPLVVGALIRLSREAGAARIQVADAQGVFAAIAEGAERIDLAGNDLPNAVVEIPLGKVIQRAPLPAPLIEADVIISIPKAKTDHVEPVCGAMALWLGAVNRQWREFNSGDRDTAGRFADIMTVSRPDLCVVDALICGEGDGPSANLPRWCGAILATTDPVAADVAIAQLMGLDWKKLRFAEAGEARGLGERQPIVWLGPPIEEVCFHAWPAHEGFDHLPVHVLVGQGVTVEGTIGEVRSALDGMQRRGELRQVIRTKGVPTVMIGDVEDPAFEEHVLQGPYLVFDDAARAEYKSDPRVHFVPGHPVLRTALPALRKGMGSEADGKAAFQYGPIARKVATVAAPVAVAALAVLGGLVGAGLHARRQEQDEAKSRR